MFKIRLNFLIVFILFLIVTGCTEHSNNNNTSSFKYGVIYTSNLKQKSQIILYSKNWNIVKEINLNFGGLKKGEVYAEKLYIPVTGIPKKPGDKILEFDLKTGNIRYINTKKMPTKLVATDDFLYVIHNTRVNSGLLTKINLKSNSIIKETLLTGVLGEVSVTNNKVYVIADAPDTKRQYIHELDKNLDKINTKKNVYTAFPTDSLYFNNKLLIINNAKYDFSAPTSNIVALNNNTSTLELIKLKEVAPYQVFKNKDNIIITHYDFPTRSGSMVTVLNKELNQINEYNLKNDLFLSHIGDNALYSFNNYNLYKYDIDDFKLLKEIQLKKIEGMVITDFFILDREN